MQFRNRCTELVAWRDDPKRERFVYIEHGNGSFLKTHNLSVHIPGHEGGEPRVLFRDLNLNFPCADGEGGEGGGGRGRGGGGPRGLLICGSSGVGKTSFLRAVCRLWTNGAGEIVGPSHGQVMFLTQRPFVSPLQPTLRQQLCYGFEEWSPKTSQVKEALQAVDLASYASRLDEKNEWHNVLSHGEAQRLCFARVLLWYAKQSRYKKQALWLFLDEATSNLDVANEASLYSLLKGLPRLQWVSVAHRNLDLYHDVRLTLPSGVVENIP